MSRDQPPLGGEGFGDDALGDAEADLTAERGQRLIPRTVKAALSIVGLEALLLALAVSFLVSTVVQDAETDMRLTLVTIVSALLVMTTLFAGGLAILRGRRWGRSPLITWQILQIVVAVPTFGTQAWPLGVMLVALSLVGIVALASPGVTRHLHWREMPPGL